MLIPVAALGIAAILGERLLTRSPIAGRVLLTAVPFALIILTVLTATTVGPFLLPPAFLLIFPALWLQPDAALPALGDTPPGADS